VIVKNNHQTMRLLARASLISQLLLLVPLSTSGNVFSTEFLKEPRIINGYVAPKDRYPYSVSMRNFQGHFCGGTLIGNDVVLTAAHCLANGAPGSVSIGSDNVDSGEKRNVASALEHPKYNINNDDYDIALVFLEASTSRDIAMPKLNRESSFPSAGGKAITMGWGKTDSGGASLPDELLAVELDVISNSECERASKGGYNYVGDIYDSMLCTHTKEKDACQGDSGGPLVIQSGGDGDDPTQDILVGIVSWGVGCAYLPGVFARVSEGMDWIEKTVCDISEDPPGSLCNTTGRVLTTEFPSSFPTNNPTEIPTDSPSTSPTKNRPATNPATEFPSSFPSKNPTEIVTDSPSTSPATSRVNCVNDDSWEYKRNNRVKDCDYIKSRPKRRCTKFGVDNTMRVVRASEACPLACNEACKYF